MQFRIIVTLALLGFLFGCGGGANVQPKAQPHYTLGLSHLQGGNPTLALKEFLKAVEENPKDHKVHAALARAYQSKRAYEMAEKHYLKALELSDNDPRYQNNLAALYISMGRWDQAITYFDLAASNLLFMRSELALMGKGYALYKKGDYPAALQSYREAEAIAPRLPPLHFHLGETYDAMGQVELARAAYEKALMFAPGYSEARYQLAVLLLKQKQLDEAKKELKILVEKDPLSDWGGKAAEFLKTMK